MNAIKSQQELLEENKSLKSEIAALHKSNEKLKEYAEFIEESEQQFKAFANQTAEGITVADLEGNYVYVNPTFCKMSGYSERELLEMTVFDMKAKDQSHLSFYNSKENMEGVPICVNLQRKDKTEYLTEIVGNNIVIGDDKLVLGTIRDISESKQLEESLNQKTDELIEAQRIGNLGSWSQDLIKKEISWSNQIYKIFGIESSYELAFDTIYNFVHPDDKELLKTVFNESVKKKKAYSLEYRIVLNDDSIRWLLEQAECVCDSNGNVIKVIGIVQDITEHKLAEEKINVSELKYRSIFESTPIALWEEDFSNVKVLLDTLKKKGVKHFKKYFDEHPEFVQECANSAIIIDINDEAVLLHEATSKSDLLNNLTDFFLPESFEAFKNELTALAEGQLRCELETLVKTKNGDKKNVHIRFAIAPGYEADFKKVYISMQDISDLKKTQSNLIKNQDKLNEVLSIANLGSFVFDDSTDLFETSLIADEILGIDKLYKRDIEGWASLIHPEDLERVQQFVDNIDVKSGNIELRVIRIIDKKTIWLFANVKKEFDDSGLRAKITGTIRDITKQKETTKALIDSENMLIETQQVAKIGSYVLNFETGLWKSSLELDMIFGIKSGAKKGVISWLDVIHPDDKEMMDKYLETNVMLNHEFFNKEYRIINAKTKKTLWVHGMGELEFDDKGNLLLMKGTIQDITNRKTISDAFKKSSELLVNLSAQIPGVIYQFLLRPDGTSCFPYASIGIKDIYGVTPEQITESAELVFDMIHPDDLEHVGESIQKSADNLSQWHDQYRIILPDNKEPFWVEGHAIPQRLDDGSTLWHGIITNIDQRKKAEKDIQFLSEITQQSKNAILTANLDYEITWVNEAFIKIYGYSLKEVLGKPPIILSADFLANDIQDEIYDSVVAGNKYKIESLDKKKDGTVFPVEIEVFPILDKEGHVFAYSSHIVDITDRKKKEEQLKKSIKVAEENETRFKALHNASFGGIAIHDKGVILDCNQGLAEITGYSVDELIGMDGFLLIEESFREIVIDNISSDYEKPYEVFGIRKNKEVYPLRLDGKVIPYKGKQVRSVEFRDITEQRKSELDLQNSNSLLSSIIESPTNIIMFAIDLNYNYLSFNKAHAIEMMSIYNVEIKVGKSPLDYMKVAADKKLAIDNYKRVLKGERFSLVQEYGMANSRLWYHLIFNPIFDDSNKVTGFTCFVTNITDRKKVEEELKESEKRYRVLADNSTDTIWMMQLDGTFLYHSPAVFQLRGYTPEEANKVSMEQTMTPESLKLLGKLFAQEDEKPMKERWNKLRLELEMYRKDGTKIWTEVSANAVFDKNDQMIGLQGSTHEISDRKKIEEELEVYHQSLEELVKDRTKELEDKNTELDTAMKVFVGREMKIRELNKKIKQLEDK